MTTPRPGTLYGIGVGPGDPELITLKGLRLLQRVRRVFLPATAPGRSFAGAIAAPHLDPARHQICELVCPPLRDRAALVARWATLADEVAAALVEGEDAAFLTEGDPSLYSTFQYLAAGLRHNHPTVRVETVPGVTAALAAAAAAATPLAMWDEPLVIAPATAPGETLRAALALGGTTVALKPGSGSERLRALVAEAGDTFDITVVRRAGRPAQAIARGEAALAGELDYFSLAILRRKRP